MRAFSVCLCAALAVVVAGAAGCGEPRNPAAAIPLDAGVSLTSMDVREEIELPPHLARAFVTMVHGRPNRSSITSTPSEPMGWFRVAGNTFYLHGGTVVLGEGDDERSWHGPLLQILMDRWNDAGYNSARLPQIVAGITQEDLDHLTRDSQ